MEAGPQAPIIVHAAFVSSGTYGTYLNRIKLIIIPYIFWITLLLVFTDVVTFIVNYFKIPIAINHYYTLNLSNYLASLLHPSSTSIGHLWYLNNLIILFAFAPLLLIIKRRFIFIVLTFLLALVYYYYYPASILKYRFVMFFLWGLCWV